MNDSLSTILLHVVKTLPDSISERKEVLVAIANLITRKHKGFDLVQTQLAAIETVERLQKELPLNFRGDGE